MLTMILQRIKTNPQLKKRLLWMTMHPLRTRPRLWLRWFQPFYMKRGKKTVIYRSVRRDIVPFHNFVLGSYSIVEDYATINNQVGDVVIGSASRIGLHNTIIGPVTIGDNVLLAQNVVIAGLNHNFEDVYEPISQQGVETKPVVIEDDVWVGANSVVLPGITIGKHAVVGAGSVVTRNIPSFSVALGNPAKVIKQYDAEHKQWIKSNLDENIDRIQR